MQVGRLAQTVVMRLPRCTRLPRAAAASCASAASAHQQLARLPARAAALGPTVRCPPSISDLGHARSGRTGVNMRCFSWMPPTSALLYFLASGPEMMGGPQTHSLRVETLEALAPKQAVLLRRRGVSTRLAAAHPTVAAATISREGEKPRRTELPSPQRRRAAHSICSRRGSPAAAPAAPAPASVRERAPHALL